MALNVLKAPCAMTEIINFQHVEIKNDDCSPICAVSNRQTLNAKFHHLALHMLYIKLNSNIKYVKFNSAVRFLHSKHYFLSSYYSFFFHFYKTLCHCIRSISKYIFLEPYSYNLFTFSDLDITFRN